MSKDTTPQIRGNRYEKPLDRLTAFGTFGKPHRKYTPPRARSPEADEAIIKIEEVYKRLTEEPPEESEV